MAAPITHIALTEKIFEKYFTDKVKKDFFIGTLFPDIRYLKVIERDKTHFLNLSVYNLHHDESFWAGLKFHSILDAVREKFIVKSGIYSLCPESKYTIQSLKVLEDEIFYQYVKNWSEYVDYLNKILPNENNFGIADKNLQRWHKLLQDYFKKQPDEQTVTEFALGIGFSGEAAREMNKNIVIMKANENIINALHELYGSFDLLLE